MSTHPIRYIDWAQCVICNSNLRPESVESDFALVSCYHCDVVLKIPLRLSQAEIVPPKNQSVDG